MVATQAIMFEVGMIMLVSFIGAALASKAKQSVILGYIVAGVLIGPFIHFNLFGIQYDGLIKDTSFISYLSSLGLTLLMFFVGLEFSVTKLKKTKSSAFILALVNTGLDFFIGLLIGLALGWPIVDTVFLAGVIAMGSAAITGQSLMELHKMSSPETEFLLGMVVVEDFLSMILMTIAGGLLFKSGGSNPMTLTTMIVGVLGTEATGKGIESGNPGYEILVVLEPGVRDPVAAVRNLPFAFLYNRMRHKVIHAGQRLEDAQPGGVDIDLAIAIRGQHVLDAGQYLLVLRRIVRIQDTTR